MKGINAKRAQKKKRAAEKKQRISTRSNGYTKGRFAQPPHPPRPKGPTTMLIRQHIREDG